MRQRRSKAEIIKRLDTERRRLERNLTHLRRADMLRPGVVGVSSVKDILAHLADWEAHMLTWLAGARLGLLVETPGPGLTWQQLDILNERIYAAHCNESLNEVLDYFFSTHNDFMEMVAAMPEAEMLKRGQYAFLGKQAVYDWLKGYANHDLWGKNKIRQWMKAHKKLGNK